MNKYAQTDTFLGALSHIVSMHGLGRRDAVTSQHLTTDDRDDVIDHYFGDHPAQLAADSVDMYSVGQIESPALGYIMVLNMPAGHDPVYVAAAIDLD